MRELLAERAPRTLIAVAAVATLVVGGAAVRHQRHHHHHGRHFPFPAQCSEPTPHHVHAAHAAFATGATGTTKSVDLDGDGVPELVSMTFSEDAGRLITHVAVERLERGALVSVEGANMQLVAPIDPAPCIGTAVAWPASSPGGGRIELSDYARTGNGITCERAGTRVFRLRGGQLLESAPAASPLRTK